MPSTIKRLLLSRKTVLVLIALLVAAMAVGYLFPQRFSSTPEIAEKWRKAHPLLAPLHEGFGLDHVHTAWWFAAILSIFTISLLLSTMEQVRTSGRMASAPLPPAKVEGEKVSVSAEELAGIMGQAGYRRMKGAGGVIRFARHPWGYWGNSLFHAGMALVIVSSLVIVMTEKRGLLHLFEGETYTPGVPWLSEESGILAGPFVLPAPVRLDRVGAEFWETDDLKQLTMEISFWGPDGPPERGLLAINRTLDWGSLRVCQDQTFGSAFFVEFTTPDGVKHGEILQIHNPSGREKAGYGNFRFSWAPYLLKAKYYADYARRTIVSEEPLLVLRLMDGDRVVGERSLRKGESGVLGPYAVKLVKSSRWGGLIFADITGMSGIFLGFSIIILGGALNYFTPPREFRAVKTETGFLVAWKGTRFEEFYMEEREGVMAALKAKRDET